jgi:hypothetical protein
MGLELESCAHLSVIQSVTNPEWGGAATAQGVSPISANLSHRLLVDLDLDLDLDLDFAFGHTCIRHNFESILSV